MEHSSDESEIIAVDYLEDKPIKVDPLRKIKFLLPPEDIDRDLFLLSANPNIEEAQITLDVRNKTVHQPLSPTSSFSYDSDCDLMHTNISSKSFCHQNPVQNSRTHPNAHPPPSNISRTLPNAHPPHSNIARTVPNANLSHSNIARTLPNAQPTRSNTARTLPKSTSNTVRPLPRTTGPPTLIPIEKAIPIYNSNGKQTTFYMVPEKAGAIEIKGVVYAVEPNGSLTRVININDVNKAISTSQPTPTFIKHPIPLSAVEPNNPVITNVNQFRATATPSGQTYPTMPLTNSLPGNLMLLNPSAVDRSSHPTPKAVNGMTHVNPPTQVTIGGVCYDLVARHPNGTAQQQAAIRQQMAFQQNLKCHRKRLNQKPKYPNSSLDVNALRGSSNKISKTT